MDANLHQKVLEVYGNRIRIRVCGCLVHDGKLLMLRHDGIGESGYYWNVPGGEIGGAESLKNCLVREFLEETNLSIKPGKLLKVNQFNKAPLHSIEYYFEVKLISGSASLGLDPELNGVLSELKWFSKSEFHGLDKLVKPVFLEELIF